MSVESALARGRVAAERLMLDTCTVERPAGETTGPGGVITTTMSTIYTGKCRLKIETAATAASGSDVGEAYRIVTRRVLQLPMSATGLREGDRVTMTTSRLDPALAGTVYTVRDVPKGTTLTRRDVTVIEVTS